MMNSGSVSDILLGAASCKRPRRRDPLHGDSGVKKAVILTSLVLGFGLALVNPTKASAG